MVIVISAMIGAGKTSLTKLIAEHFNIEALYESVDDNPLLSMFYTAREGKNQSERYPFLLQLWFLNTRFRAIKQALVKNCTVLDRSIYEDLYFAKVNKDLGRISDLEFSIYEDLLDNMMGELEGAPKKSPDLMIYLTGSFETILNRINKRGREYELSPDLISYYKTLWEGYDDWISTNYRASEVLKINIDNLDFVNNHDDKNTILKMIENKLKEIRGE